ncbi:MAG: carboxypeptidase-like regulatory domain-containing protein, partial [Chitinophagaceae bacterium]|nr:carboxypeptidase-like regulatory domain-containing protein [Chitinophagaceae bacterium]
MKAILTICFFLIFSGFIFAQNALRISGKVTDAGKPIEGATVSLHAIDNTKLNSIAANKDGLFELTVPKSGTYKLSISAVGYKAQWSGLIEVKSSVKLPEFLLTQDTKKLDEVVVTGKKPLIEQKIDRMV